MVEVQDVIEYLGEDSSFSEDEVANALEVEALAQSKVCKVPGSDYPVDLAAALMRRVARHLNMKRKPLGYEPNAEGGLSYISANDSEIKRLEAPYRKRVIA